MVKLFYIITVLLLVSLLEIPHLRKKEFKRERKYYFIFSLVSSGLLTAKMMDLRVPNPLKVMDLIYSPISDAVFQLLT